MYMSEIKTPFGSMMTILFFSQRKLQPELYMMLSSEQQVKLLQQAMDLLFRLHSLYHASLPFLLTALPQIYCAAASVLALQRPLHPAAPLLILIRGATVETA